jgi:hypothetical protein
MKLSKKDTYSLTQSIKEIPDNQLRDIKFTLNFRYLGHMQKNHQEAADSAHNLIAEIKKELQSRSKKNENT